MKYQNKTWNQLLEQSAELAKRLAPVIEQKLKSRKPRFKLVRELRGLVMKHVEGFRLLMSERNFPCATVLLRTLYEAVTRLVWIRFSAPETVVTKMLVRLAEEDLARSAGNSPMAKEMLDQLMAAREFHVGSSGPCLGSGLKD